jgi:hypothetical protein
MQSTIEACFKRLLKKSEKEGGAALQRCIWRSLGKPASAAEVNETHVPQALKHRSEIAAHNARLKACSTRR